MLPTQSALPDIEGIKAAKQVSAKTGFIASIEPKEVATPFPPLNPKNAAEALKKMLAERGEL